MTGVQARQAAETEADPIDDMQATFRGMKDAFKTRRAPDYAERRRHLTRLYHAVIAYGDEIAEAVSADFGHRSRHETLLAEVTLTAAAIRHARRNLRSWMKPRYVGVGPAFWPARARVLYQPKGVVGIIAPWNYPFYLAIPPLASALAAGNRVMVKPSEYTPRTAELMRRMLAQVFGPDHVAVVTGGPEVGAAFTRLPFGHLLYTGSTNVGRLVMRAAAENLTPVTLEMGGKSPAIVGPDYPVAKAAKAIMSGKWLNAGQTCIAPDYVMVPEGKVEAFAEAARTETAKLYPTLEDNPDYSSLNNDGHYARVAGYVDDARKKGARIVELNPADETLSAKKRKMCPTLVLDPTEEMTVLKEEIFGPVLPILAYGQLEEAIQYVNDRPAPLALYYFDDDSRRVDHVLERTVSGGAAVNETVFHCAVDGLPFGGIGSSGMGAVHGDGFETFSHKKAVFHQSRLNAGFLLRPPFGRLTERVLGVLAAIK